MVQAWGLGDSMMGVGGLNDGVFKNLYIFIYKYIYKNIFKKLIKNIIIELIYNCRSEPADWNKINMINLKNLKIKIINDLVDRLYNILWELDCVRFVELGLGGFLVNEFNELKNSIECEIKYILSTNNDF